MADVFVDEVRVQTLAEDLGAAHRPFLEAALRSQPWIEAVPAEKVLAAGGR